MKKINDLESYWMPFTANRDFKKDPIDTVLITRLTFFRTIDISEP